MNKRFALATAVTIAALSIAPAAANPVTGPIDGLDITQSDSCAGINVTMVVNKVKWDDEVEGTVFTLEKLAGIDLTTTAGWDAVKGMDVDKASAAPKDGQWYATSDASGKAYFSGLPSGAYLVTATIPNDGKHQTPAPFVITLPTGGTDRWNCEPTINAKFKPVAPTTTPTKPEYPPYVPGDNPDPTPRPTDSVQGVRDDPTPPMREDRVLGIRKGLASTGAAVIGVVGAAVALMALGIMLVRRRKNAE
ncbi:isopeptide-forming domain-containing protein [Corynebacterium kalinowskii]|nr:SpaA isopeptide-forming pilin-related protein [Corynebacterium kalinowskii]